MLQTVIISLAAMAIGLGLHSYFTVNRYISETSSISRNAASMLERYVSADALSDEVMTAYFELTGDEREQVGTEAYRARFASYTQREDYAQINSVLSEFAEDFNLSAIYVAR